MHLTTKQLALCSLFLIRYQQLLIHRNSSDELQILLLSLEDVLYLVLGQSFYYNLLMVTQIRAAEIAANIASLN